MERGKAVGLADDEIFQLLGVDFDVAVDSVVEGDVAVHAKADGAFVFVGPTVGEQAVDVLVVQVEALALAKWALVKVDAQPLQVVEDGLGRLLGGAFLVGVFKAEDKLAAVVAGEGPVEQGGAGAADVQGAGRAGSEARDDFSRGWC